MNLCIDIGNTKCKTAFFENGQLMGKQSFKNHSLHKIQEICTEWQPTNVILTATGNYDEAIDRFLKKNYFYLKLSHNTLLPFTNHYATPATLGRDRIAAIAGTQVSYPATNCLVIDAGTCITFDIIDKESNYFGGSIHPGITMRFKALHNFTDKLPLIKRKEAFTLIGNSTESSILSGVLRAILHEMDGMITEYKSKYENLTIIFTGGDASFFVSHLKNEIFAHPNLVLVGLNKILSFNAKQYN